MIQAWYPGARGGEAIAAVLYGRTNPSGHLPVTFPASVDQLPRRTIDGFDTLEPDFAGNPPGPTSRLTVDYDIEGSDVGYRWNARKKLKPLFPFGFGLSYTRFATTALQVDGTTANLTVANTGDRDGATVAQLYLVSRNGKSERRLVGYRRAELARGASQLVTMTIDPRLLADWRDGQWSLPEGTFGFAIGDDAEKLGPTVSARYERRRWRDGPISAVRP